MVSLAFFARNYLRLMPDEDLSEAGQALDAARAKAAAAGIPDFKNNAYYDRFIYMLAGAWVDNKSLSTPGSAAQAGADAMQSLINQAVLELRYAKDGDCCE